MKNERYFYSKEIDATLTVSYESRKTLLEMIDEMVKMMNSSEGYRDCQYGILYKDGSADIIDEEFDGHKIRRTNIKSIVYTDGSGVMVYGHFEVNDALSVTASDEDVVDESIEEVNSPDYTEETKIFIAHSAESENIMTGYVAEVKYFNGNDEEIELTVDEKSDEETSSSSEQTENNLISSATTLGVYSVKGVAVKGFVDRNEIDLNFNTIQQINHHFFAHDLGYIRYGERKWSFSSDEKNLTAEILHKLIELYDDDITPDKIWVKGKTFTPIEFIDFLYMKESYFILTHCHTYEKGFFHIYHGYASKKLLIDTNKSNIFNKWKYIAPITKWDFLEAIKWVCGDTSPDESHYTRAIALTSDGIIKLIATHSRIGYTFFDENGKIFSGAYFTRKAVTNKEKLFADENGEISSFCKIILSSKDRV